MSSPLTCRFVGALGFCVATSGIGAKTSLTGHIRPENSGADSGLGGVKFDLAAVQRSVG